MSSVEDIEHLHQFVIIHRIGHQEFIPQR